MGKIEWHFSVKICFGKSQEKSSTGGKTQLTCFTNFTYEVPKWNVQSKFFFIKHHLKNYYQGNNKKHQYDQAKLTLRPEVVPLLKKEYFLNNLSDLVKHLVMLPAKL